MRTINDIEKRITELKAQIIELEQKKTELLSSTYKYNKVYYVSFSVWNNLEFPQTAKIVIHSCDNYGVHATVFYTERQFELRMQNDNELLFVAPKFEEVQDKADEIGENSSSRLYFDISEKIIK